MIINMPPPLDPTIAWRPLGKLTCVARFPNGTAFGLTWVWRRYPVYPNSHGGAIVFFGRKCWLFGSGPSVRQQPAQEFWP